MKKILFSLFCGLALLTMISCGGGGGGGGDSSPPIVNESIDGIWNGTIEAQVGSTSKSIGFVGVISTTGEGIFVIADPNYTSLEISEKTDSEGKQIMQEKIVAQAFAPYKELILGEKQALEKLRDLKSVILFAENLSINRETFSCYLHSYDYLGLKNGGYNASGTVKTRSKITGNYSDPSLGSGSFSFSYDPIYERGSDLSRLAGEWQITTPWGETVYMNIRSNGGFDGIITNRANLLFTGNFSIIDSRYNCYKVSFDLSGISYKGLAVLTDLIPGSGQNDLIIAIGVSPYRYLLYPLIGARKK